MHITFLEGNALICIHCMEKYQIIYNMVLASKLKSIVSVCLSTRIILYPLYVHARYWVHACRAAIIVYMMLSVSQVNHNYLVIIIIKLTLGQGLFTMISTAHCCI